MTRTRRRRLRCLPARALWIALAGATFAPLGAAAQAGTDAEARASAAEAFDRGVAASLSRDYVRAAGWFETANRLSPSSTALHQAIRASERADDFVRAATLSLRLVAQFPGDAGPVTAANTLLEQARPRLVRVDVVCVGCSVDLDGTLQEHPSFFLEPGEEHSVVAHFTTGDRSAPVRGEAGSVQTLGFTAPPPAETTPVEVTPGEPSPPRHLVPRDDAGDGWSPMFTWIGLGLTGASAGLLVWSTVDTLAARDRYEAGPTRALYDEGRSAELRTNTMIGVTGGLGVATLAIALFATDWGSASDSSHHPTVAAQFVHGAATLSVEKYY